MRSDLRISGEQEQQLITLSVNEGQNLKDLRKKAVAILTPQQRERLQQLHLQSMGPAALGDLAVVKALKYTPEQRKMVKTLPGQVRRATLEALEGAQNGARSHRETDGGTRKNLQGGLRIADPGTAGEVRKNERPQD